MMYTIQENQSVKHCRTMINAVIDGVCQQNTRAPVKFKHAQPEVIS